MSTKTTITLAISALSITGLTFAQDEGNTRWGAKLGGGNKDWSFVEATMTTPVWESTGSVLNFDLHLMNHIERENRDSNEVSLGLVYRKKLSDKPGFWGINTSYSFYKSWDGRDRETPHLGLEYVEERFSFKLNHMFQDKTRHLNDYATTATHSYYGDDILGVEEAFTGGTEILASYHPTDRLSLGFGAYNRHGEPAARQARIEFASGTSVVVPVVQRHLLESGYFFEGSYYIPGSRGDGYTFSFQAKDDRTNNGLYMLSFEYSFGGSKSGSQGIRVEREYRNTVYKADPDDFGIIAGIAALAGVGVATVAEAGADVAVGALAAELGADVTADAAAGIAGSEITAATASSIGEAVLTGSTAEESEAALSQMFITLFEQ